MPRFTGGAVGALAYDAISAFETTVPLPERDPVGVPTAAFIETDLVLVFDHLTHTLSAIASLHTDAPDLEGRYRIAEEAIFEALERSARPSAAEMAGSRAGSRPAGRPMGRAAAGGHAVARRPGRHQPRARGVHPRRRGRQGRHRGRRGDPGRARPAPVVRPPGRPRDRDHARRDRALPRAAPGQPEPVPVLRPDSRRSRSSAHRRSCSSRSRATSSTTHPIAGTRPRGAERREDALLSEELQRDPKERAEHVMLVDLGRNDLGGSPGRGP